eukprot:scaffold4159_cov62-Phaeocystis_antarctica.AAC.3
MEPCAAGSQKRCGCAEQLGPPEGIGCCELGILQGVNTAVCASIPTCPASTLLRSSCNSLSSSSWLSLLARWQRPWRRGWRRRLAPAADAGTKNIGNDGGHGAVSTGKKFASAVLAVCV